MKTCLAADIGGTNSRLTFFRSTGEDIFERTLPSTSFASFNDLLKTFFQQGSISAPIDSACFAVAGPVTGKEADVTNLPWKLKRDQLQTEFNISQLHLCNDFEAVGYGITCLKEEDLITLQSGEPVRHAVKAVIGAGTGLGQAILLPEEKGWRVMPTEGGHVDFAPTTALQIALLEYLQAKLEHVSYENVVSGPGLVSIYQFLQIGRQSVDVDLMEQNDPAAAISQYAYRYPDSLASQALDMFIQIYGAQAGNLALSTIPRAGLYIAGGIAAKNLSRMKNGQFMHAFRAKGKMKELVKTIPVKVIQQPKVGLFGAKLLAQNNVT